MKTGLKIEGFEEADRNLKKLAEVADKTELRALGRDALRPVSQMAKQIVRRDTGRLAKSIRVGSRLSARQAALYPPERDTVEVYVGPGPLPQAVTEEFGTVNEVGHPFMRPAWDAKLQTVLERLRDGAAARLKRVTKG
jgi:hypothetical protein